MTNKFQTFSPDSETMAEISLRKMTEYNLDFFQAMEAWEKGAGVECTNGELCAGYLADSYDRNITFPLWIIKAKWRIVEQPKCWLDQKYPIDYLNKHGEDRRVIRQFAHEAIKRIEVLELELRKNSGHNIETVLTGAIRILKTLIGER